ncbi:T9SS type A sorting domain-containing protein [Fulvivirga sediminis]|uniref:T9SS type A sorting domain-containing protein n=1 Tax=Fulvivirga sediminis TaxID=2803949 RepID=A0A937F7T5_9BACT|nr:T9SS type A sorting domain-containing protein [Fulvivirga sediminis]MBL3655663.1 T9SS type A sorting domain-containing protein [Fulvivirga sediminis]
MRKFYISQLLLLSFLLAISPAWSQSIFINEIHYDNAGADSQEGIEIAGPAGSDLAGWSLVFYNGNGGAPYSTQSLSGVLPNQGNGYGTLFFYESGIQNGSPDGVALVDNASNVIQFLSYEGTFVAVGGIADGLTSTDIVLEEASSTPVGYSLQLGGTGSVYTDFSWQNAQGSTYTEINTGQSFGGDSGGPNNPMVLINEIDVDTPGSDQEEFIELYDGGEGNTSLDGLVLVFYNGNGDASYNAFDLTGYSTNAAGYFVLGNAAVANVDLVFSNNGLQNGADAIALYQGTVADFPSGTLVTTDNLVDAVVYDTDDSDDPELLTLLNPGEPQLNENEGGDKDNVSLQRMPNGGGGARNTSAYVTAAPTPGTENGEVLPPGEFQTIAEARALPLGTSVTLRGVITVSDQFAGPAYIQDATGGIAVFDATVHGEGLFSIGDSIEISGITEAYNDQVQLGTVSNVVDFGVAAQPIGPQVVTLSELSNHPGELVTVVNATFPNPGDILFGNSNYKLVDASGTGELRIDADVDNLAGYEQPEACSSITGVVGRYRDVFQLLPRRVTDIPCASPYEPDGEDLEIPRQSTFDVAAWNIEWFGNEGNAPAPDAVQKDSVKAILLALDADIIAVEEIVDTVLFDQMISEMPGYDYFLSSFVSNPGQYDNSQKVGFIYKTATVAPDFEASRALLSTIHPLYNGGDDSYLVGYPDSRDRFWASGRLPFMLEADVTIEGITKKINMLVVHARANSSSDPQSRYDMRKYDVEVLKDSLDTYYGDANLIMLGDFNDDLDVTVANVSTTVSTYEEYIADTTDYKLITLSLSNQGLRTYVFYENVIDHIVASDEIAEYFLEGSARVGYQFYNSEYAYTTSDHLPVSARFQFAEEVVDNDFTVTSVVSFKQGKRANGWPVSFIRSNPDKALGEPLENFYYNFVSLGFGGEITLELDNYMYDLEGNDFRVYESSFGPLELPCFIYPEKAEVFVSEDGNEFYRVGTTCQNGDFDLANAGVKRAKFIRVKDVTKKNIFLGLADGYDLDGIYNLHQPAKGGRILADHQNYVPNEDGGLEAEVYPNPFSEYLTINVSSMESKEVKVSVTDIMGRQVMAQPFSLEMGQSGLQLELGQLPKGVYILRITGTDDAEILKRTVVKGR